MTKDSPIRDLARALSHLGNALEYDDGSAEAERAIQHYEDEARAALDEIAKSGAALVH